MSCVQRLIVLPGLPGRITQEFTADGLEFSFPPHYPGLPRMLIASLCLPRSSITGEMGINSRLFGLFMGSSPAGWRRKHVMMRSRLQREPLAYAAQPSGRPPPVGYLRRRIGSLELKKIKKDES